MTKYAAHAPRRMHQQKANAGSPQNRTTQIDFISIRKLRGLIQTFDINEHLIASIASFLKYSLINPRVLRGTRLWLARGESRDRDGSFVARRRRDAPPSRVRRAEGGGARVTERPAPPKLDPLCSVSP